MASQCVSKLGWARGSSGSRFQGSGLKVRALMLDCRVHQHDRLLLGWACFSRVSASGVFGGRYRKPP